MPKPNIEIKKGEHVHLWADSPDLLVKRCTGCKSVLVSQHEYERRVNEWNKYFERVRETESYKNWQRGREALKNRDLATVFEVAAQAKERLEENKYEDLQKPNFFDPATWPYYVVATKEELERAEEAERAFDTIRTQKGYGANV